MKGLTTANRELSLQLVNHEMIITTKSNKEMYRYFMMALKALVISKYYQN